MKPSTPGTPQSALGISPRPLSESGVSSQRGGKDNPASPLASPSDSQLKNRGGATPLELSVSSPAEVKPNLERRRSVAQAIMNLEQQQGSPGVEPVTFPLAFPEVGGIGIILASSNGKVMVERIVNGSAKRMAFQASAKGIPQACLVGGAGRQMAVTCGRLSGMRSLQSTVPLSPASRLRSAGRISTRDCVLMYVQ